MAQAKIELTPEILLSFSDIYLNSQFDDPVPTPKIHLEWWAYVCLPKRYVALAAPRGHAKSTAISHVFVLGAICLRVKRHVLIVSDTEGQAAMFVGNIKKELLENQPLRETFGVKRLLKESETEIIIQWTDGQRTRVFARGAGQAIRGVTWEGKRPDLVVCDDLENDEAVMNIERREKFSNWFLKVLIPCGARSCQFRIVGTILHEDSLLARLMPNEIEDDNCVSEPLKVTTTTDRAWLSVLYRAHPDFDDYSVLLWPEQWSEKRLKEERQTYIDEGSPEGYAQEYLNNPMASDGAYFDEDNLLPILPEELDRGSAQPESYYIGVDMAISLVSRRAYTVFAVAGLAADKVLRVRQIIRKRMDSLEICETMFELNEKYARLSQERTQPVFLVEKENIAKAIGPFLEEEMRDRDEYLLMEMLVPINDKMLRARAIQARTRAGRVEFDHTAGWWPTLKHELLTFPSSTYKDQVDALAWLGFHIANMSAAPTWNQIQDDEYYEEYEDADMGGNTGRCSVTGY